MQASLFNATLTKKDARVENANQGALGFPVVLAMLADQTAFNLGHDFAPGLKEMSNFSPSALPSHHLDPCYGSKDGIHEISQTIYNPFVGLFVKCYS